MIKSDLYGALLRGYCHEKNKGKVLDNDLLEAIADEVLLLHCQNQGSLERSSFHKELESLINRYSCENESDTPDWVLAEYLERCLTAFNACVNMRERFYGRELKMSEGK